MACNCTEDAIRQLLEQRQFALATQINSIVENSERNEHKDLIDQKWIKHLLEVGNGEDAIALLFSGHKIDEAIREILSNRQIIRILILILYQSSLKVS